MFFMCFLLSLRRVSRHLIITPDQCKCQHINIVSSKAKKHFKRTNKKNSIKHNPTEKRTNLTTPEERGKKSNVMHPL
jgi:hypothetical protein